MFVCKTDLVVLLKSFKNKTLTFFFPIFFFWQVHADQLEMVAGLDGAQATKLKLNSSPLIIIKF